MGKTKHGKNWTATLNDRLEQHHQSDEDDKQQQAMNDAGSIEEPVDDDISLVSELSETRSTFLMNRLSEGKHPHIAMQVRVCTRETTHPARSLSLSRRRLLRSVSPHACCRLEWRRQPAIQNNERRAIAAMRESGGRPCFSGVIVRSTAWLGVLHRWSGVSCGTSHATRSYDSRSARTSTRSRAGKLDLPRAATRERGPRSSSAFASLRARTASCKSMRVCACLHRLGARCRSEISIARAVAGRCSALSFRAGTVAAPAPPLHGGEGCGVDVAS